MSGAKERPILFSSAMVRAIIEGRKTQTRRVLKLKGDALAYFNSHSDPGLSERLLSWCPYGQPGDRLWVRETWTLEDCGDDGQRIIWAADRAAAWVEAPKSLGDIYYLPSDHHPRRPFKPSIHMPCWASRLTLEVTEIRVQRLQEISEADARAEGVAGPFDEFFTPRIRFEALWDSINGERPGCSWEANPWVWCVSFGRVQ